NGHYLVELDVLRMGNECLQQLVAERDQQIAELSERPEATAQGEPQAEALFAEVQTLREQLKEKEAAIEQLQTAGQAESKESFANVGDHDYEAELTQFRRQLEADRQELNQEIEQLRARNAELNEVVREAELQLS